MPKAAHVPRYPGPHLSGRPRPTALEAAALSFMRKNGITPEPASKSQGLGGEIKLLVCGIQCLWHKSHVET